MSDAASRSPVSLRRRIVTGGLAAAGVVALGLALAIWLGQETRRELASVTTAIIEEQRISHRIDAAVMRQLATVTAYAVQGDERHRREFRAAGDEAYEQIQAYLFRDLTEEERLALQDAKERLQDLEVAATQASDLFARGEVGAGNAAFDRAVEHIYGLLDALDAFLRMREGALEVLQRRHAESFRLIYASVAGVTALLVAAVFFLGWLVRRSVMRPLSTLTRAAREIEAGRFDTRIPPGDHAEFIAVAEAFNDMADELSSVTARLEGRNLELSEALKKVRSAQADLVEAEKFRALGQMSAGIAHELNNPLATVQGYAQLLSAQLNERPAPSADEIEREYLDPILREAARAHHLVRSFLRVSRRGSAKLVPVPLHETLQVVENLQRFRFEQAGLDLVIADVPECDVLAEPHDLESVLLNLLGNAYDALEGRGGPGRAVVRSTVTDGKVTLVVEDDGPGLAQPESIFEPFYTTKPIGKGTGLGLALVKRAVTEFGGSIRAENRTEGGARFVIVLPRAPDEAATEGTEEGGSRAEGARPAVAVDARGEGGSPVILVVEDEEDLRRLQQRLLRRISAEVVLSSSVPEARRVLSDRPVDLVISDIRMPGESGADLYHWVEQRHPGLRERFLFVTGDIGADSTGDLARERPELFIRKPFDMNDYLLRVQAALS